VSLDNADTVIEGAPLLASFATGWRLHRSHSRFTYVHPRQIAIIDADRPLLSLLLVARATPRPLLRLLHQHSLHRIAMHIAQCLHAFMFRADPFIPTPSFVIPSKARNLLPCRRTEQQIPHRLKPVRNDNRQRICTDCTVSRHPLQNLSRHAMASTEAPQGPTPPP